MKETDRGIGHKHSILGACHRYWLWRRYIFLPSEMETMMDAYEMVLADLRRRRELIDAAISAVEAVRDNFGAATVIDISRAPGLQAALHSADLTNN